MQGLSQNEKAPSSEGASCADYLYDSDNVELSDNALIVTWNGLQFSALLPSAIQASLAATCAGPVARFEIPL